MVVGVLLTIDIAILTTWQVIDPFYRETKLLEPYVSRRSFSSFSFLLFSSNSGSGCCFDLI
jgi:hypothetical protein